MPRRVRLIDPGPLSAAAQMALDRVLLDACHERGEVILRFLEFAPACVLIGYHQSLNLEVDAAFCHARGLDLNRRLTGGGCIYLASGDLGWEIVAPADILPSGMANRYRLLCGAVVSGLRRLGIPADFRPANDIEVEGRKLSGTGGISRGSAFLFQGTILVDLDLDVMGAALRLPPAKMADKGITGLAQRLTSLSRVLGLPPDKEDLKEALAHGFATTLDLSVEPGRLTPAEEVSWEELRPYYEEVTWRQGLIEPEWVRREALREHKAPGGIIRAAVVLDARRLILKQVWLSGDFFLNPPRALADMETWLKDCPADADTVARRVNDFSTLHPWEAPGVTPEDFALVINSAVAATATV